MSRYPDERRKAVVAKLLPWAQACMLTHNMQALSVAA